MIGFIIALIVILLDQVTKYWALGLEGKQNIIIIDKFLELTYLENRGAAFGILQGKSWFFIIISLAVIVYLVYFIGKNKDLELLIQIPLGLILGGAVGNLIDRIIRGYVVDFIFVRFWGYYDFPVFNVADMGVVIGVFIIVILTLFTDKIGDDF